MPSSEHKRPDYTAATEVPGNRITPEAMRMLLTRYAHAASFCAGKDVLEVACGAGQGLGYMARRARWVVGGDFTRTLLNIAQRHYRGRIPLVCLDAHVLPFRDESFDVVLLFEAIYYLARPEKFLRECRRVLRPGGMLLLCSANKQWPGFNPSPLSRHYFAANELVQLLISNDFDAEIYGAFPAVASTPSQKVVAFIRRLAARWHLIPKTMKGKELLKQIFYGHLAVVGHELEDSLGRIETLFPLSSGEGPSRYRVLYAIARPRAATPIWQDSREVFSVTTRS